MKPLHECHVLVTPTSYGRFDPRQKTELETAVGRVTYNTTGKPLTSAQLQELLPDVDGYIAGLDEIDETAVASAPCLRVIARYGVGTNNVDLAAAAAHGVIVTNTPGANAASVAELTIALMLNLQRPILAAAAETRQGGWPRLKGVSLVGKTVGLLGLGAIGKEVARRLAGFDCAVWAYDVVTDEAFVRQHHVTLTTMDALLTHADVLSLHLPVLPSTRQMVNADFLQQMKPGAYLINTSRGELVDEAALYTALATGHLAGAALDAFSQEPPGTENPLLSLPQVIPTPHMGAHSDDATNAMGRMALADCLAVLRGDEPLYRIV
ncbi:MAG: phosphoglycerate dehydrogenase [Anaerolineales bacterium]|nr:phosphoglycerate dehydrogenase [Anaerolineales bacterium]